MQVFAGDAATVEVLFVNNGAAVDVQGAVVSILAEDGSPFITDAVPVRTAVGNYVYSFLVPVDAAPGSWTALWRGRIPGLGIDSTAVEMFDVLAPLDVPSLGGTVEGVQKFVPLFSISETSSPNRAQVEDFIEEISARVAARLGALAGVEGPALARIRHAAVGLVNLGAAAMTEDAGHPESSGPGASAYGRVLWDRFEAGLAELVAETAQGEPGVVIDPATGLPVNTRPSAFGPPPLFTTAERF